MRRWLKRIGIALVISGALLLAAAPFAARYLVRFVPHDMRFGAWRVRVNDPRISLAWTLSVPELLLQGPGIDIEARNVTLDPAIVHSLRHRRMTARVGGDSLVVRIDTAHAPAGDTASKTRRLPPEKIAFPSFTIPASIQAHLRALSVLADSAALVAGHGIDIALGRTDASLGVQTIRSSRYLPNRRPSLHASFDWRRADSLATTVRVRDEMDSVFISTRHSKDNLLRGMAAIALYIDSAGRYRPFSTNTPPLPSFRSIVLDGHVAFDTLPACTLSLAASIGALDTNGPYRLGRQDVAMHLGVEGTRGRWTLTGSGERGEQTDLRGTLLLEGSSMPASIDELAARLATRVNGRIGGMSIATGDTFVVAEASLSDVYVDHRTVEGHMVSGDGSTINLHLERSRSKWGGDARIRVSHTERWYRTFVDTNVTFDSAFLQASLEPPGLAVGLRAYGIGAYGAWADTLRAGQVVTARRYRLDSARIINGDTVWRASGSVDYDRRPAFPAITFEAEAPGRGLLTFVMNEPDSFSMTADSFHAAYAPYPPLHRFRLKDATVDGAFGWAFKRGTGLASAGITGTVEGRLLSSSITARWEKDTLAIDSLGLVLDGSSLTGSARLYLAGKAFYQLADLPTRSYLSAELHTSDMELEPLVAVAPRVGPVQSGMIEGSIRYTKEGGVTGALDVRNLVLQAPSPVDSLSLRLRAGADSIVATGRSQSTTMELFQDSLHLIVAGVRGDTQSVRLRVIADRTLTVTLDGRIARLRSAEGDFEIRGATVLPGGAGRLTDLTVTGRMDVEKLGTPLETFALRTDTAVATYRSDIMEPQTVRFAASLEDGIAEIQPVVITNPAGDRLEGSLRYPYAREGTEPQGMLEGDRFGVQWGRDKSAVIQKPSIRLEHRDGAQAFTASARRATVEYRQGLLTVGGHLDEVKATYRSAGREAVATSSSPRLALSGHLRDTKLRYLVRNFSDLETLLSDVGGESRSTSNERPLQVDIDLETAGSDNRIVTDVLTLSYAGSVSIEGPMAYALLRGRLNALEGEIGATGQTYEVRRLRVKWLNEPFREGAVEMEALKRLAADCRQGTTDSCVVYVRLDGTLAQQQFSYDSDCGGGFGQGADVSALVLSVQRGCYSPALAMDDERSLGSRALSLLEPTISRGVARFVSKYTNNWIADMEISGLGAFAADSASQAVSVKMATKELWRFRLKGTSGYQPDTESGESPWSHRLALEFRPPLAKLISDSLLHRRIEDNVTLEASVERDPTNADVQREDELRQQVGLRYRFRFWELFGP